MQAGNNDSDNTVEKLNLEDQDAVWNFIQENFQAILDMDREQRINRSFEVLYRCVYTMCNHFGEGRLVYNGVRQMVRQHIDKMVAELQQNMANGQDLGNPIVLQVNKLCPLFNVDTIIEIMSFLTTPKLAQQLSTAARQMAKLSDYVLNKRKPILRPIQVWNGNNDNGITIEPFITHLKKEDATNITGEQCIFDNWFINRAPAESRICLPDIEPPEWLAGVELIYIMGSQNDKIFAFLNALQRKLQNCQIHLNLRSFFVELQKTGHSAQFFALFNERCFSLVQTNFSWFNVDFDAQWPCWAIFNNIFFPNLRELHFPLDKLEVDKVEVLKWLMHPSTEHQPRLLRLPDARVSEKWLQWKFVAMLRKIKEDFFNPTGKRMFFVELELPYGTAIPASQQGEWQNAIGEQLRIESKKITRLPMDQCDKKFKDFYELPAMQPKLIFK